MIVFYIVGVVFVGAMFANLVMMFFTSVLYRRELNYYDHVPTIFVHLGAIIVLGVSLLFMTGMLVENYYF